VITDRKSHRLNESVILRRASGCLLFAVALTWFSGCGEGSSKLSAQATPRETRSSGTSSQALRTCVDRWNQGNMLGWGPGLVNVAFRRPAAKEHSSMVLPSRRQCIVAIAVEGGSWTCVLVSRGAYWCPPLHEPTGPSLRANAAISRRGVLKLDSPLKGTHSTSPLAWQRYPHVDGFIEPWTAGGKLRAGLRFKGEGRGRCFRVDETARSALSCLRRTLARYDACFPQRRHWQAGDLAACGSLGHTSFVRWTITGHS
jgi:hypothetical protein